MKILMVSSSILPSKGGSSVIAESLSQNFTKDELVVLGGKMPFQGIDTIRPKEGAEFIYFGTELSLFGRGARYFTWFRQLMFNPLVNKIKKIIKSRNIDYVIGVYPNDFYCHAASIAATSLDVPFSSYFHNTYVDNTGIVDPQAGGIQKEIFDNSNYIFVMSDGMKHFYNEHYPGYDFRTLVHTFNKYPTPVNHLRSIGMDDVIKLVAIGNFNESNIESTKRFVNAIAKTDKYELSLYTHVPKVMLRSRGLDVDSIDYKGFVDFNLVHEALQDYDICVLTHGFTGGYGEIEYQTIFPTRTIPLLLSGKPIIAHSPDGSFLNDFIRESGCAHLVSIPDEGAILAGLDRIVNDEIYHKKLVKAAQKTAFRFYGPEVVGNLKTLLKQSYT